ncbi:hypothetical protein RchiOBHm_Chr1g0369361 [Rosa chinensis]|uniref:Uncharacterized protein n=1 Tax=Rosa chinensis TaxID=74649 RepID=A0A2P6SL23_ROSCH|nr:hypothetical protein RchiOBHm_Chr1g0369361 [Rosa chinensis]
MPSCMLTAKPPLNLADCPLLDFPAFLPDPLIWLPMPTSQQIPTFKPLIFDPIVQIPVMDICSSGHGYLVSAGLAISTGIPPLHSNLMNPLIPQTASMLEKDARERLRWLLISGSTQSSSPLMDVLPAMLTNADENRNMLVVGSHGLYTGTSDVDVIANSIAAMSMVSLPGISTGGTVLENCGSNNGFDIQDAGSSGLGGSCLEDQGTFCSNYGMKRTDE